MKNKCSTGGIIIFIGVLLSSSTKAQDVALKEILLQQTDTGKLDLKKPFYLEVEESKLINLFDRQPNFGVYHDNYSNGKDSLASRGWNYITLSGVYFFNPCFSVQIKGWAFRPDIS